MDLLFRELAWGGDYLCSNLMRGTITLEGSFLSPNCNDDSYKKWIRAVNHEPSYLFPYFYLSYCYKKNGIPNWQDYALKTKNILDKTTKLEGHNPLQDDILKEIDKMLK